MALVQDARVRQQIETFLTEMQLPDLRTAFFDSVPDFESLYFRDQTSTAAVASDAADQPNPDVPTETELRLFSEVHVVIYAMDAVGQMGAAWLDRLRPAMARFNHLPATGLRIVLLKYEDDNVPKIDLLHLGLDDLIFLPLDRLVFMQKMQIFLSLPKRVSPSFLFNQELKQKIEISKITKLERLNDVGLAIRNPVPLRKGLAGHFYLTLPGERIPLAIKGKVLRTEPLDTHPGQYLIYFSFFGLTKPQASAIRRLLQKDPHYKNLLHEDPARFAFNPADLFLNDKQRHRFGVVIIDRDENEASLLAQSLRGDMDRLEVQIEHSYSLFLHRYLDRDTVSFADDLPDATATGDFFADTVEFTVRGSDQTLLQVLPEPKATDLVLGFKAADLNVDGVWSRLAGDRTTRVLLAEAPALVASGRPLEKLVVMVDQAGRRRAVRLTITPGDVDGVIKAAARPAYAADITARAQSERRVPNLEALVVEADALPPDPTAWVEGLRNSVRDHNLTTEGHELKFWVVSARDEVPDAWLNIPEILGAFRRPVDLRQMLFSFSENLSNHNTRYQFPNLGWSQPSLNVHVAKGIELEAVSEYGATLKSAQRLIPGTMVYLRKGIFDQAPNECLAARVYACEEDPADAAYFQIYVTYWGINDAFLKFARTWIRENYALTRAKE